MENTENTELKLCKDCKYYKTYYPYYPSRLHIALGKCTSPDATYTEISLIDGIEIIKDDFPEFQRAGIAYYKEPCGKEGKYWELKPKVPTKWESFIKWLREIL